VWRKYSGKEKEPREGRKEKTKVNRERRKKWIKIGRKNYK